MRCSPQVASAAGALSSVCRGPELQSFCKSLWMEFPAGGVRRPDLPRKQLQTRQLSNSLICAGAVPRIW